MRVGNCGRHLMSLHRYDIMDGFNINKNWSVGQLQGQNERQSGWGLLTL